MRSGDLVGGRFRVESLAGTGGMGSVWRTHDLETGRTVALKLLHGRDPRDTARFIREAQLIAALAHPGIVGHVADGQISESERYLVMEWLEGESLADRMDRAPLTLAEALGMGRRAAEALGAMHRHGIVHRDLKPSNLFLEAGDPARVKIIDFGIARRAGGPEVTRTGVLLGTPGFIAPEQALGDPNVDARADVFALGCVLFKCITGEGAFGTEDDLTILLRIVKGTAQRARDVVRRLPAEIDELLAGMLARSPDERPRDASVVAAVLARLETIYGSGHPGDDPLEDFITTQSRAVEYDYTLDDPLLGSTSPFPLTVPRARPSEPSDDDAPLLSPDDLEEIRTDPGRTDASRAFAAQVARAIAAAETQPPPAAAHEPAAVTPAMMTPLPVASPTPPALVAVPAMVTPLPVAPPVPARTTPRPPTPPGGSPAAPVAPALVAVPAMLTPLPVPARTTPRPPTPSGGSPAAPVAPATPAALAAPSAVATPLPGAPPISVPAAPVAPATVRTPVSGVAAVPAAPAAVRTPLPGVAAAPAVPAAPAVASAPVAPAPAPLPDEDNAPAVRRYLEQVEGFLRRNDFRNALVHARRGVQAGARGQLYGALCTRQAEAHRWRGERFHAERAASEAMTALQPGTDFWWLAAREAVLGAGARSDAARVGALAEDIMRHWSGERADASCVGTLVCTAGFLVHTGQKELLGRFLQWAAPMLGGAGREPPAIAARVHQLRALRAVYEGDLGTNLQASEAASERFTAAHDMRNSLIQRVNVAFAKVELGAYAHAEADLRAAITSAERMGLNNVALAARANLGIVLARRGNHADARAIMVDVLKESVSEGDRRFEASARTQLSLILVAAGDVEGAVREAKGAVELTPRDAPPRVFALGALARAQLAHGRAMAALEAAEQAMDLLVTLGGIEEGESLVRLVFAQAKRGTGDLEGAAAAITAARERLHARALLIKDLAFRQSFLRDVPDNAQTLHLCREWLEESRDWST